MTRTKSSQSDQLDVERSRSAERSCSSKRSRRRKRRKFFGQIMAWVWQVLIAPIKLLFLPTSLVEMFYFRGRKTGRRRGIKSTGQRIKYGWKETLRLPYRLISKGFRRRNLKDLLFLLPSMVAVGFVCFVGFQLSVHHQRIQDRYSSGAREALLSGNLDLASTYFRRLFDRSSLSAAESLQWVTVLRAAGEYGRADRLLARLAPDDGQGYPAAHAMRAIELAGSVDGRWTFGDLGVGEKINLDIAWIQSPDSGKIDRAIEQLRTHLRSANEDDPRVHLAWAKYWLCQRDIETACERIKLATESHELSAQAVHLIDRRLSAEHLEEYEREQLVEVKQNLLVEARELFEGKLKLDPLNHHARIQLAATMVGQGKRQAAKDCLREGIVFQADPSLRRGLADVFVLEYRAETLEVEQTAQPHSPAESLRKRVNQLKAAISADPNYMLPYACLAKLLSDGQGDADELGSLGSQPVVGVFQWLITSDQPAALDHIGLASLHWRQGNRDLAQWHLDQAWAIDSRVSEKAHRLATAFAFFAEKPDLSWARKLVDRALLNRPESSEILLSQGRILLEQGQAELAVQQLNRSLSEASFPEEVHEALEVGYVKLGNLNLAYKHSGLAEAARTRRIVSGWK